MTVENTNKKSDVAQPSKDTPYHASESPPEAISDSGEDFYSPENSLLQIDSISQRIADLSDTLQTPDSQNLWHEANARIIEFRAELARLQNDLQTQHQQDRTPTIEHEILRALGQQMEALAQQVRLSTEQSDRTYEGNLSCIHAVLKELKADIEVLKSTDTNASAADNTTEQIAALGQLLVEEFDKLGTTHGTGQAIDLLSKRFNALEERLAQPIPGVESNSPLYEMDDRITQLLGTFSNIENRFNEISSPSSEEHEDSSSILEMSCKIDALMALLENRAPTPSTTELDYRHQIDALTERVTKTQSTLDSLVTSIKQMMPVVTNQRPAPTTEQPIPAALPSWEQQKKAILEGYGFDSPESKTQAPLPKTQNQPTPQDAAEAKLETPAPTLSESESETPPELEDLKTQLEEKLRRAEIEISIERAKIHQERRELETIQHDITRQQAKIESHNVPATNDDGDNEEGGRRWSRFLGN
ncbi:MAG: hypothetical protein P8J33_01355 [Pirellulaceae bacterium]|nr:hypothetical protein [Pirellulaceae bacterium]